MEYKEMIKGFIEQAVNFGLKVEERRGLSRSGRSRMMKVVSMIDEKLVELTDMILDQEKPQIKLLEKIGQPCSLLVVVRVNPHKKGDFNPVSISG